MYMRIYIFCFKKTRIQTKQISISKFIRANLRLFKPFTSFFLFKTSAVTVVFNCKLYLKNSIKLIIFFFCSRPGEDFFRHLHFRKQEYYFLALATPQSSKTRCLENKEKIMIITQYLSISVLTYVNTAFSIKTLGRESTFLLKFLLLVHCPTLAKILKKI